MTYNVFIKARSNIYNILNIEKDDLQIVIDAFNYGKEDFFIGGKKYWMSRLFEIRIFTFQNPDRFEEFVRLARASGLFKTYFGTEFLPPEALRQGGEDVTKEFIKGGYGYLVEPLKHTSMNNDIDIFISHSSSDAEIARLLIEIVRKAFNIPSERIRCTSVPGYKLKAGATTDDEIKKEIFTSKAFIGLLTRESFSSTYVLFELGARWGANLPLIPLICDKAGAALLNGPIKNINALSAVDSSDMLQFLHDLGETLSLEPENPSGYISDIEKLKKIITYTENIPKVEIINDTDEYADAEKITKIQSEIEWPDDYEMRLHYIESQSAAIKKLKMGKPKDLTDQEFQKIRMRSKRDWPLNFEMRLHEEETQIDSLRKLKNI
jgi:hypothetical protein